MHWHLGHLFILRYLQEISGDAMWLNSSVQYHTKEQMTGNDGLIDQNQTVNCVLKKKKIKYYMASHTHMFLLNIPF